MNIELLGGIGMNREEILAELKTLILHILDEPEKFSDNVFMASWECKQREIRTDVKALNSCDKDWLSDEYCSWFKVIVAPHMSKVDESIKDRLEWQ
jgi:hypothetical protein